MPVAAKYNEMGTKVEGKIERGQIRKGQQLLLMPNRVMNYFTLLWLRVLWY